MTGLAGPTGNQSLATSVQDEIQDGCRLTVFRTVLEERPDKWGRQNLWENPAFMDFAVPGARMLVNFGQFASLFCGIS